MANKKNKTARIKPSSLAENNEMVIRRIREHPEIVEEIKNRQRTNSQWRNEQDKLLYRMEFDRLRNHMITRENRPYPKMYNDRFKELQALFKRAVGNNLYDIQKNIDDTAFEANDRRGRMDIFYSP